MQDRNGAAEPALMLMFVRPPLNNQYCIALHDIALHCIALHDTVSVSVVCMTWRWMAQSFHHGLPFLCPVDDAAAAAATAVAFPSALRAAILALVPPPSFFCLHSQHIAFFSSFSSIARVA